LKAYRVVITCDRCHEEYEHDVANQTMNMSWTTMFGGRVMSGRKGVNLCGPCTTNFQRYWMGVQF
jgi:hypothetical protein